MRSCRLQGGVASAPGLEAREAVLSPRVVLVAGVSADDRDPRQRAEVPASLEEERLDLLAGQGVPIELVRLGEEGDALGVDRPAFLVARAAQALEQGLELDDRFAESAGGNLGQGDHLRARPERALSPARLLPL